MPQQFSFPLFDNCVAGSGSNILSGIAITGSHTLDPGFTDVWAFGDYAPTSTIYITLKGSFDPGFPQLEWLTTVGTALTVPLVTLASSSNFVVYEAPGQAGLLYNFSVSNHDSSVKPYIISVSTALTAEQAVGLFADNPFIPGFPVADSPASVANYLDNLATMASSISSVMLTGATVPTLSLSANQYNADALLVEKITSPFNLNITIGAGTEFVAAPHNIPINSKGGQNTIVGEGHHHAIIFSDASTSHSIITGSNGSVTVAGAGLPSNQLLNIEFIVFADKTMFVENADGANIARLYSAALGRSPDLAGLSGWEDIYSNNISSAAKAGGVYLALAQTPNGFGTTIAGGFAQSVEFQNRYGHLDDGGFISQLYLNVLSRTPGEAELTAWLDLMHHQGFTRDMALVGFAESPENIAKTAAEWLIQV